MNSIWNVLIIHPSALGVAVGTWFAGNWLNRRQAWGSAAVAFLGYTLLFRIFRLVFASFQTPNNDYLLQFLFLTILGMIVAGMIGFIQGGIKSAGWHAVAGSIGFNIGWLINDSVSIYIIRQAMVVDLSQLVVGSPTYYLYFVLPSLFFGAAIGACLGIAAGVERLKKPAYLPV